jgi:phospholipid transport system transporter-binding protein
MIRREGDRLTIEGVVTLETLGPLLDAVRAQPSTGLRAVDVAAVTDADSSLLALLLAIARAAGTSGPRITIENADPGLRSLAGLYGVDALLLADAG